MRSRREDKGKGGDEEQLRGQRKRERMRSKREYKRKGRG